MKHVGLILVIGFAVLKESHPLNPGILKYDRYMKDFESTGRQLKGEKKSEEINGLIVKRANPSVRTTYNSETTFADDQNNAQVDQNYTIDAILHQLEVQKKPTTVAEWGDLFEKTVEEYAKSRDSTNFSKILVHIRKKADDIYAAVRDAIDEEKYTAAITKYFPNESKTQELRSGNYYRCWVLILHNLINKIDCEQLNKLRALLKNDRHKVHTFADQMQRLRTIDLYNQRQYITYFNTTKIGEAILDLSSNIGFAVKNFMCSEDVNCE